MPIDLIVGLAGAAIVAVVVNDVFQSVIVPRPASRWRPSALISRRGWQVTGTIGMRFRNAEKRENFFGVFAPALLVTLLIFWVTALILGLGLVFFALRSNLKPAPENVWGAAYYAGTSLLTLGCRILTDQSILDAYGHLSARLSDRPDQFMISRGMSPALVEPEDFIVLDLDGKMMAGSGHPNAE